MKRRDGTACTHAARLVYWAAAMAAGASSAIAAPPELRAEGGLLVLPNVRVERAAQPVDGKATAREAGMKVFKDRETGHLRPALPEDLLASTPRASRSAPGAVQVSVSANGKSARLDEAFHAYAVARKDEAGRLDMTCVTGETKSLKVLQVPSSAVEGHRHAH